MRSKLIPLLALAASVLCPPSALAVDGTITFDGLIQAPTCTINGGAPSFTVQLPTVSASTLATAGASAGTTPWRIELTNCSPTGGHVLTYFEPGSPTVDPGTGNLNLDGSSTATQVQFRLLDSYFYPIDLSYQSAWGPWTTYIGGSITLNYYVEYVSLGGATVGTANSSIEYTMVYL